MRILLKLGRNNAKWRKKAKNYCDFWYFVIKSK